MRVDFFPIDVDYVTDHKGRAVIRIFGRTLDEKRVCVFDETFNPYFWAILNEHATKSLIERIKNIKTKDNQRVAFVVNVEEEHKKHLGKDVRALRITVNHPSDVNIIKDKIKHMTGIQECLETDILYYRRYIIDKGLIPLVACTAEGEEVESSIAAEVCVNATRITQNGNEIMKSPRILAFDIEVYNKLKTPNDEKDPIVMLSFHGNNYDKVITWKEFDNPKKYVEFVKDEGELIVKFKDAINEYKPDYLVGYFSDGFDLPYLKARADKYRIKLNIGIDQSNIKFSRRANNPTAKVTGIAHIDIFKFIKRVMRDILDVESYDLNNVSKALLGQGKKEGVRVEELYKAWDEHHDQLKDFAEYNLLDSKLAYNLTQVMLPHLNELVKLISLPIEDVSRMTYGQLVEWYMLRHMKDFNEISNNRPTYEEKTQRRYDTYEGAYVYQPKPGVYKNIIVFDFKSLYPSIIVDHNICVSTITTNKKDNNNSPELLYHNNKTQFYFDKKTQGFIPTILKDILDRRSRVKSMMKKDKKDPILDARQYGLKILANSFYGYFGFSGARWYSNECAAAITAYARDYIKKTIQEAEHQKFKIIYGDTDSIFITLEKKTRKDAEAFVESINKKLPGFMELEFENFYPMGIFVMKKSNEKGAKKKYALIDEKGKIKVTGFETIRGDWSIIAKEVQKKVFEIILKEKNNEKAVKYVKEVIKKIRNNEYPLEKFIIRKQLKKRIEDYESVGPHVKVAEQLRKRGEIMTAGTIISFIVNEGKGIIRDRAKPVDESKNYDSEYYINNQVIPSVERILEVLGIPREELAKEHKQKKLGDY